MLAKATSSGTRRSGMVLLAVLVVTVLLTLAAYYYSDWMLAEYQAADSAEQLLLYSELARRLVPEKRVRLQFVVISKTKVPQIERHIVSFDARRLHRTKRIVERIWRAIVAEHFYPAPSPMQCPGCPFRSPCRRWTG